MAITNLSIRSKAEFLKYHSLQNKNASKNSSCSIKSPRMRSVVNKSNACYNNNCNKTIRGVNKMFVKTIKQNDVTSIIFPGELDIPAGVTFRISVTKEQNIILQPLEGEFKKTSGVSKEMFDEAYSLATQHYHNAFKELVNK